MTVIVLCNNINKTVNYRMALLCNSAIKGKNITVKAAHLWNQWRYKPGDKAIQDRNRSCQKFCFSQHFTPSVCWGGDNVAL